MGATLALHFLEHEMKQRKLVGFHTTPEVDEAIEAERRRLADKLPGSRVNKSVAVRSLIVKASTMVDKVDD